MIRRLLGKGKSSTWTSYEEDKHGRLSFPLRSPAKCYSLSFVMNMVGYWKCPNCGRVMSNDRMSESRIYGDLVCDGCTVELRDYLWVGDEGGELE